MPTTTPATATGFMPASSSEASRAETTEAEDALAADPPDFPALAFASDFFFPESPFAEPSAFELSCVVFWSSDPDCLPEVPLPDCCATGAAAGVGVGVGTVGVGTSGVTGVTGPLGAAVPTCTLPILAQLTPERAAL